MTQQTINFDAPHNGSPTSIAAAASVSGAIANTLRGKVFAAIECSKHGLTREECSEATGIRLATVCARVNELLKVGKLHTVGTRPTTSKRQAAVLVVR